MALLGLLSLGQVVVLPGYLLLRALRVGGGTLGTCILSFALSLVINHFLVAGFVLLGVYRPGVVYAVFAAELALLLLMDGQRLKTGLAELIGAWRRQAGEFLHELEHADTSATVGCTERTAGDIEGCAESWTPENISCRIAPVHVTHHGTGISAIHSPPGEAVWLRRSLVAAAALVIGGFALTGIAQTGEIFQQWDAVVSWNRWAVDWAAGRLPFATSIYPQLLPTNMSLTYVFMQSSAVWIFAKAFQFLFCLMLLLALLDMARVQGKFGYVPGVVITYGLLVALLRFRMLSSGYADVPLAFFTLASVYAMALARRTNDPRQRVKCLMIGAMLAAGAALTKQTGLYVVVIYPILVRQFVLRGDELGSPRQRLPTLLGMCLLMGILVSPWYIYKFCDFQSGCDCNNTVLLLTDFHEGRDLLQRMSYGGAMIVEATTPIGVILLLIAVAASLREPFQRWLVGIFVVPLGLIWAMAFSYDLRNLALLIPWVGAAAGIGLMQVVSWGARLGRLVQGSLGRRAPTRSLGRQVPLLSHRGTKKNSAPGKTFLRVGHVVGILTLLLVTTCLCISDATLLSWQRRQQRFVGMPELNRRLYAYAADHPDEAMIATDYQAMRLVAGLGTAERSLRLS